MEGLSPDFDFDPVYGLLFTCSLSFCSLGKSIKVFSKQKFIKQEHHHRQGKPENFLSPGNGSGGSIQLGGVIASDVGDTGRIEDLRGVKIPHYDANFANLDDFILDWEDFAEEVVGEMRLRSDVRDKWACRTFPHRLAPETKADLRDAIREKRIRAEEQYLDWLEQEERVDTPNQKLDDLWEGVQVISPKVPPMSKAG